MLKTRQLFEFTSTFIGLSLVGMALFACNQNEKVSGNVPVTLESGSASVRIPALPAGYLAKTGAGGRVEFVITISGSGMNPIQKSWNLSTYHPDSVVITGIPVGNNRVFTGKLFQIDSVKHDSTLSHEGSDTVSIESNIIAQVKLFLLRQGGTGSAQVCVNIEGWGYDSSCVQGPPSPPPPKWKNVAGCWIMKIHRYPYSPQKDSLITAKLTLIQTDSNLFAVLKWPSGKMDTTRGFINNYATLFLGPWNTRFPFYMKAAIDSSGSQFYGDINDSARHITGSVTAMRTYCDYVCDQSVDTTCYPPIDTITHPPVDTSKHPPIDSLPHPPIDTNFFPDTTKNQPPKLSTLSGCYEVAQGVVTSKSGFGRMMISVQGSSVQGNITWAGYPKMKIMGNVMQSAPSGKDSMSVYGVAPKGMLTNASKTSDTLEYHAAFASAKATIFNGDVLRLMPTALKSIGVWKGAKVACTAKDSLQ